MIPLELHDAKNDSVQMHIPLVSTISQQLYLSVYKQRYVGVQSNNGTTNTTVVHGTGHQ